MAWTRPSEIGEYLGVLENPARPEWEKVEVLNTNGTAWVVRDTANGVLALQSYSTVVSVLMGGEVRRLGKWSVTTSKHQCQFERWCRDIEG